MKELNRREFLTLTGAAVVALSLAGCGGPSAPPAPPAVPTGKEAKVLEALNLYRGKLSPLTLDSGLNKAAEELAKVILSNKTFGDGEDAFPEAHKAIKGYKNAELYPPIGLFMNKVSEDTYKAAPAHGSPPSAGEGTNVIKKHPQRSAHGPRQPGSAAADAFLPAADPLRAGPLTQAGQNVFIIPLKLHKRMRNWLRCTFWTMMRNPVPISTSFGQKP